MSGRVAKVRARLERGLSSALARLPDAALTRLVPPAPPIDGNDLDPHVALLLVLAERLVGPRPWEVPIEDARTEFARQSAIVTESPRSDVVTEDGVVPGPEGNIPVRVVRPRGARGPRPGVVYFHGGGWVLGSRTTHQGLCERLAADADCVVVSVDYRLAPEHRFPAAWVDAVAAYRHVASHAATYGIAPGRVAVAGDSAGGNLSAGVCIAARDAGEPMPLAQLLIYPATDLRRTMASHRTFAHGYFLDDPTMTWFLAQYTPDTATRDDPRASPLYAKDVSGLPHAIVVTAGFDPLRDEGKAYADRLRDAGVPVAYVCHGGHVHGFASMTHAVPSARRAVSAMVRDFATILHTPSLRVLARVRGRPCHATCAVIAGHPTFSHQAWAEAAHAAEIQGCARARLLACPGVGARMGQGDIVFRAGLSRFLVGGVALVGLPLVYPETHPMAWVYGVYLGAAAVEQVIIRKGLGGHARSIVFGLVDGAIITFTVHQLGSLSTPLASIYVFAGVLNALAIGPRVGVAISVINALAFLGVVTLEQLGVLTYAPGVPLVRAAGMPTVGAAVITSAILSFLLVTSTVFVGVLLKLLGQREAELLSANARLEELSVRDPLTGLHNRRHLLDQLELELARVRRGQRLALLMLDLDGFKRVNDTQGHLVGDMLLKEVATALASTTRHGDVVARYGGDEFAALLPEATEDQARAAATRIAAAVREVGLRFDEARPVTASVGVAVAVPEDGAASLLRRADESAYDAKRGGGNQVSHSQPRQKAS